MASPYVYSKDFILEPQVQSYVNICTSRFAFMYTLHVPKKVAITLYWGFKTLKLILFIDLGGSIISKHKYLVNVLYKGLESAIIKLFKVKIITILKVPERIRSLHMHALGTCRR